MKKIYLLYPPISNWERYSSGLGNVGGRQIPLGIFFLAAFLRRNNYDVRVRDAEAGELTPQAIVGRARLCYQRRLYADALQLARKATNEYPAYPEAWIILADVLDKMGKPSEAEVIRSRAQECTNTPPAS